MVNVHCTTIDLQMRPEYGHMLTPEKMTLNFCTMQEYQKYCTKLI